VHYTYGGLNICKGYAILLTMKPVRATITSKNQLTIPAVFVRNMHLNRNKQVRVKQRGNNLILTPIPSLQESLQPVWRQASEHVTGALTDEELKASLRQIAARDLT
jgi:virulence-associated protein VagC